MGERIADIIAWLLGTEKTKHDTPFCHLEDPALIHSISMGDSLIGISYYLIPITLIVYVWTQWNRITETHKIFLMLFVCFVISCGTTHFFSAYVLWYPQFEYENIVIWICVFFNFLTLFALPYLGYLESKRPTQREYKRLESKIEDIKGRYGL